MAGPATAAPPPPMQVPGQPEPQGPHPWLKRSSSSSSAATTTSAEGYGTLSSASVSTPTAQRLRPVKRAGAPVAVGNNPRLTSHTLEKMLGKKEHSNSNMNNMNMKMQKNDPRSNDDANHGMAPATSASSARLIERDYRPADENEYWARWHFFEPKYLIMFCSTVESADMALVGAVYKAFERDFHFRPTDLGLLALCQMGSFSLFLPIWGAALPKFGCRNLLTFAGFLWMLTTVLTPFGSWLPAQALLRVLNGAALCGVVPVSQAVLADVVEEHSRGFVFGCVGALHGVAKVLVTYYAISNIDHWQQCFYFVAVITGLVSVLCWTQLPKNYGKQTTEPEEGSFTIQAVNNCKKVLQLPSFAVMIGQGIFGGTPWQAMMFLNMYWLTLGFTNSQAATIAATTHIGGIFGPLIGGALGDYASRKVSNSQGRVVVAQTSVLLGIPLWCLLLNQNVIDRNHMGNAILIGFLFYLCATWTTYAANRPICAELVSNSAERAQVVGMWVLIEGCFASVLGAPIVGLVSEAFGYKLDPNKVPDSATHMAQEHTNAQALSGALVGLGVVCWSVCLAMWTFMYFTFPKDKQRAKEEEQDRARKALLEAQSVEQEAVEGQFDSLLVEADFSGGIEKEEVGVRNRPAMLRTSVNKEKDEENAKLKASHVSNVYESMSSSATTVDGNSSSANGSGSDDARSDWEEELRRIAIGESKPI
eukprot:g16240.t1